MARPKLPHPTPKELEILRFLWERGPSTVREILESMPDERAYTSVMSLLNVMFEKKLVSRVPEGRAFRYSAKFKPDRTQRNMLSDLLNRLFDGSAKALVARLLEQANPSADELNDIHQMIEEYQRRKEEER